MTELEKAPLGSFYLRSLGPNDLAQVTGLLDEDPWSNVFLRHRVGVSRLDPRWMGADVWGWFSDAKLSALLHVGTNVVPAQADEHATVAFIDHLLARKTKPASLVGPVEPVKAMWEALEPVWGPAHSERFDQPLLVMDRDPRGSLDRRVRQVQLDEIDVYYPACVAMFVEELGFHPERDNPAGYRARVMQIIAQGWAWAIIENGQVLFKAEVGAAGPRACQVQGVWVDPQARNHGVGTRAMAAVVQQARRKVAPDITLYVNGHNTAARIMYSRVGFRQVGTFASVFL